MTVEMLAQWEDMPDEVTSGEKVGRWVEVKLRVLYVDGVPAPGLAWHGGLRMLLDQHALQVDPLVWAPVGEAVECQGCGKVAVAFGGPATRDGLTYSAGQRKWETQAEGVYCPHCDGAEDVG